MVVIGEVGVGFGYGFVVGSYRGEFDLILGFDLVLGILGLNLVGVGLDLIYSAKEDVKPRHGRR